MRKEVAIAVILMILFSFSLATVFLTFRIPVAHRFARTAYLRHEIDYSGGEFVQSQNFAWTEFKYAKIEQIGDINNTKSVDGLNFGFRILWNTSEVDEEINFIFVMTYNAGNTSEDEYDFRPVFHVEMKHNGSLSYKFSAIVSQLANCPTEGWPFEIFGEFDNYTKLVLSFDMVEDSRYFFVRDGLIDITLSFDNVQIEEGYITEVLIDYAPLEVYDSLKFIG